MGATSHAKQDSLISMYQTGDSQMTLCNVRGLGKEGKKQRIWGY